MPAFDIDLTELDAGFKRMLSRARDLKPVWRQIRPAFRKLQAQHFKFQRGTKGAWQPLAASTRERRLGLGGRAGKFTKRGNLKKREQRKLGRLLSRKLIKKAKIKIEKFQITFTAVGPVPGIHQQGGAGGKGSQIPARDFLYVDDPFARMVWDLISESLRDAFEK